MTDDLFHRAILQVFPFIFNERFYASSTLFRLPHFLCLVNVSHPANVFPTVVLNSAQTDTHPSTLDPGSSVSMALEAVSPEPLFTNQSNEIHLFQMFAINKSMSAHLVQIGLLFQKDNTPSY